MKKVLVVDDEEVIRNIAAEFLKIFGYLCVTAEDGESAVKAVVAEKPDLVLLDMYLPGMSGEKVLEIIKSENPGVKVLLSTGRELDDDEAIRVKDKGAEGVLHKPFGIYEFKEKMAELLA